MAIRSFEGLPAPHIKHHEKAGAHTQHTVTRGAETLSPKNETPRSGGAAGLVVKVEDAEERFHDHKEEEDADGDAVPARKCA